MNQYNDMATAEKTVLDGTGAELDLFTDEFRPCKNPDCTRPARGNSDYCSDACKAAYNRWVKKQERLAREQDDIMDFTILLQGDGFRDTLQAVLQEVKYDNIISVKYIIERIRRVNKIHIRNGYSPLLARYIVYKYPWLSDKIVIHDSKYDKWIGPETWS